PTESAVDAGRKDALLETVISRAAGTSLEVYLAEHLFAPLGMNNTSGLSTPDDPETDGAGRASGRMALTSTARDLSIFAQMLVNRGLYDHRRYVSHGTLARLTGAGGPWTNQSKSDWTAGLSPSAFGHTASNGSFIWIDPARKSFFVMLVDGGPDRGRIAEFQSTIGELMVSALSVK
ncbi:MAG TPA: serine hydrolase domain-containing protein, partial [Acidobacteriota bacterium]|nr:serine hydrolase domain-containing protein [Acidobacteriota bacterium]